MMSSIGADFFQELVAGQRAESKRMIRRQEGGGMGAMFPLPADYIFLRNRTRITRERKSEK